MATDESITTDEIQLTLDPPDDAQWTRTLLVDDVRRHLAGDVADIDYKKVRITVGNRPYAFDIAELFEYQKRDLPEEWQAIAGRYRIWLTTYTLSVMQHSGSDRLRSLGFAVSYGNTNMRVSILDVLPRTEFICKREGRLRCTADLTLAGEAKLSSVISDALTAVSGIEIAGGVKGSAGVQFAGQLSLDVLSPYIAASGTGNTASEWVLNRADRPLVGVQKFHQVLLVGKNVQALKATVHAYGTVRGFFGLPAPVQSSKVDLECRRIDR
ncbi:MAG: hypothetical protein WD009_14695 [Phycisphaeraceae bacterium]